MTDPVRKVNWRIRHRERWRWRWRIQPGLRGLRPSLALFCLRATDTDILCLLTPSWIQDSGSLHGMTAAKCLNNSRSPAANPIKIRIPGILQLKNSGILIRIRIRKKSFENSIPEFFSWRIPGIRIFMGLAAGSVQCHQCSDSIFRAGGNCYPRDTLLMFRGRKFAVWGKERLREETALMQRNGMRALSPPDRRLFAQCFAKAHPKM